MITALEKFGDIFVSWYVVNLETDLINRDWEFEIDHVTD